MARALVRLCGLAVSVLAGAVVGEVDGRGADSEKPSGDDKGEPVLGENLTASGQIQVVSYNLQWWAVSQNNRWNQLYQQIRSQAPFDLIGFQECNDVAQVVGGAGLSQFDYYMGRSKPSNANPAPIAWNRNTFSRLSNAGQSVVAVDQYGDRLMTWIRLRHNPTGASVLFVNTHGPLNNCGNGVGQAWANGVRNAMQPGDTVFMTGDFNCAPGTQAINLLQGVLPLGVHHGIDHILSNKADSGGGPRGRGPSDHDLLKGAWNIGGGSPPSPPPSGCVDTDPNCPVYTQYCNMAHIQHDCPRTCGRCGGGCSDTDPNCPVYTQYCNLPHIQHDCPKSCRLCSLNSTILV